MSEKLDDKNIITEAPMPYGIKQDKENIVVQACETLGVNQTQLGEIFGVPQSTVARWKKGDIPKMAEIAIAYMLENIELKQKLDAIKKAFKVMQGL